MVSAAAAMLMPRDRYLVSMIALTQRQMSIVSMIAHPEGDCYFQPELNEQGQRWCLGEYGKRKSVCEAPAVLFHRRSRGCDALSVSVDIQLFVSSVNKDEAAVRVCSCVFVACETPPSSPPNPSHKQPDLIAPF